MVTAPKLAAVAAGLLVQVNDQNVRPGGLVYRIVRKAVEVDNVTVLPNGSSQGQGVWLEGRGNVIKFRQ